MSYWMFNYVQLVDANKIALDDFSLHSIYREHFLTFKHSPVYLVTE